MSDISNLPEDIQAEIRQARAAKGQTTKGIAAARREDEQMAPVRERIVWRGIRNSFGEEYTVTLVPKGAA